MDNYLVLQEYRFSSANTENINVFERWFDVMYATTKEHSVLTYKRTELGEAYMNGTRKKPDVIDFLREGTEKSNYKKHTNSKRPNIVRFHH